MALVQVHDTEVKVCCCCRLVSRPCTAPQHGGVIGDNTYSVTTLLSDGKEQNYQD